MAKLLPYNYYKHIAIIKNLILSLIRFYQKHLNFQGRFWKVLFLTDKSCRYQPSCSQYTYQAVEKYGSIKGLWLGLKRIARCHPWATGGKDSLE